MTNLNLWQDENQLFPGGLIQNLNLRHVSLRGDDTSIKKAKIEIQAIVNEVKFSLKLKLIKSNYLFCIKFNI